MKSMKIDPWYFRNLKCTDPLSREKECEIILAAQNGDKAARDKVVRANLRFVIRCVKKNSGYINNKNITFDDLFQQGCIGLNIAIDKFDVNRGFKFMTFAVWWIKSYIGFFLIANKNIVKIGTTGAERTLFYKSSIIMNALASIRDPIEREKVRGQLSKDYNVSVKDIKAFEYRMLRHEVSLDQPMGDWGQIHDMVGVNDGGFDAVEKKDTLNHLLNIINSSLTEREIDIISKRFLNDEPQTLNSIGAEKGVTRERIRQIEKHALNKIRNNLKCAELVN